MQVWGIVVLLTTHYFLTTTQPSTKSLVVYTPPQSPSPIVNEHPVFTVGNALIEIQRVKVEYLSEGFSALKSISESSSLVDIIWNKFPEVIKIIKSVLLMIILKYCFL